MLNAFLNFLQESLWPMNALRLKYRHQHASENEESTANDDDDDGGDDEPKSLQTNKKNSNSNGRNGDGDDHESRHHASSSTVKEQWKMKMYERMKRQNFTKRKILVLDLDETLVHASPHRPAIFDRHGRRKQKSHSNHAFYGSGGSSGRGRGGANTYQLDLYVDNIEARFYVAERPYVHLFMKQVCEWYDVIIYTASIQSYADPVIDKLDRDRRIVDRLFRESCAQKDGLFIKDLDVVADDLSRCIIIDNSPISFSWHPQNAIPIGPWLADDDNDEELLNLLPLLDALRYMDDVRSVLELRIAPPG